MEKTADGGIILTSQAKSNMPGEWRFVLEEKTPALKSILSVERHTDSSGWVGFPGWRLSTLLEKNEAKRENETEEQSAGIATFTSDSIYIDLGKGIIIHGLRKAIEEALELLKVKYERGGSLKFKELQPEESKILRALLKQKPGMKITEVNRKSDSPGDIIISGTYKTSGYNGAKATEVAFSAWLPLQIIKSFGQWTKPEIANMTDYPQMALTGDWSAVRDSDERIIWKIYQKVLETNHKLSSDPENPFELYGIDKEMIELVTKRIKKAIESGDISFNEHNHLVDKNKLLDKYSFIGASDTASREAIFKYIESNKMESGGPLSKIKIFLDRFPNDATNWGEADDKLPDLHNALAEYFPGYKGHLFEPAGTLSRKVHESPATRNKTHKEAILKLIDKLSKEDLKKFYTDHFEKAIEEALELLKVKYERGGSLKFKELQPEESKILRALLKQKPGMKITEVNRKSDSPGDIIISGTYKTSGYNGAKATEVAFSAWLPLQIIKSFGQWTKPEIANMTDYPQMALTGDWSAVRDSDERIIWKIYQKVLETNHKLSSDPENPFELYGIDKEMIELVTKRIKKAIESGDISFNEHNHLVDKNKLLDKYSFIGASDTASREAIFKYIESNKMESGGPLSKIKIFLDRFPNDATNWGEADDKLPDLHNALAEYFPGYKGHLFEPAGTLSRKVHESPATRNKTHKEAILKLIDKLSKEDLKKFYTDHFEMESGGPINGINWKSFTINELHEYLKKLGGDIDIEFPFERYTSGGTNSHLKPRVDYKKDGNKKLSIGDEGLQLVLTRGNENIYLDITVYDDKNERREIKLYSKENHDGLKKLEHEIAQKFKRGGTVGKLCKVGTKIQTLLFDKKHFTEAQAIKWLQENHFDGLKADEKENTYRFRQMSPKSFKADSFRTTNFKNKLPEGVKAVIACPVEMAQGGSIGQEEVLLNHAEQLYYDQIKGSANPVAEMRKKFPRLENMIDKNAQVTFKPMYETGGEVEEGDQDFDSYPEHDGSYDNTVEVNQADNIDEILDLFELDLIRQPFMENLMSVGPGGIKDYELDSVDGYQGDHVWLELKDVPEERFVEIDMNYQAFAKNFEDWAAKHSLINPIIMSQPEDKTMRFEVKAPIFEDGGTTGEYIPKENTFEAIFKGKKIEVQAKSSYEAQTKANLQFKTNKPWNIIIHMKGAAEDTLFESGGTTGDYVPELKTFEAMFKGKTIEVQATSTGDAQNKANLQFKTKKPWDIIIHKKGASVDTFFESGGPVAGEKEFKILYNFNHSKFGFQNQITVYAKDLDSAIEKARQACLETYGEKMVKKFTFKEASTTKHEKGGHPKGPDHKTHFWIKDAIKHKGTLTKKAIAMGWINKGEKLGHEVLEKLKGIDKGWAKKATLAETLAKFENGGLMQLFPNADEMAEAMKEGWHVKFDGLKKYKGKYEPTYVFEPVGNKSKKDVVLLVVEKASEGSALHKKALRFIKQMAPAEWSFVMTTAGKKHQSVLNKL